MIIVQGQIQAFRESDVISYIDPEILAQIKASDSHPLFKKYSVAHEGVSNPRVIGEGSMSISWGRRAIKSVKDAISTGIQCIAGHTKDNIKRGERVVAQVVGKGEELINGILNTVIVNYFPDKTDADYDVISMEADLDWYNNGAGMGIAEGITALKRFALGKSESDIPAFQDAKLLASIQCFDTSENPPKKQSPSELGKGIQMATFAEIKAAIEEMKIYPSQLFTREQIIGEAVVETNGQLTFRGGDAQITSYLVKKIPSPEDILKDSSAKITELESKIKEYEPQIQEFSTIRLQNAKLTAKDDIIKYAEEKKLTPNQTKWLEENLDKYVPGDNIKESIKTFVDAQASDYARFLKLHPSAAENPATIEGQKESSLEQTEFETKNNMY